MIPRHLKLLVLLLPLFIARSMLPLGFMVSLDEGQSRIVFCPGQLSVRGEPRHDGQQHEQAHQAHVGHEHHHGGERSDTSNVEQSHQTCPFAFAAAAPLAFADAFTPQRASSAAIAAPPEPSIFTVAVRAHPIRGPPALS